MSYFLLNFCQSSKKQHHVINFLKIKVFNIDYTNLIFKKFLDFHEYNLAERKSPAGGFRKQITDTDREIYDLRELFDAYARFGGMPMLADVGLEIDRVAATLDSVYSAPIVNDILERELTPLRKIRDSYKKIGIALESDFTQTQDGIKVIRAPNFLLE